ncbi:hypothetical protein [Pseudomonas abietaniphila]|uniref:Uncharacterized protein n=1 Tax=Pseudomonas abietaniphila TaxID=89065 RepID=A0A1G8LMM0_9PSED|nr:hypothetical protein [Pseudomonas abietaniphila]SDI56961.1 hypothetical protein SAMN05216605_114194 [Pseudomonas abietaniphila]
MSQELKKLPPFAAEVMSKLQRFEECANDFEADGVDIGRDWLDTLTHLGLLDRAQRSPALWQTTPEGDALLEAYGPPDAMDESNFAPGGWKIERTPDGGFCISHPAHGRGFFSDKGHKPAVIVSRFLEALLTYGPTAERLQAENAALQQRLSVADQPVDDLESELTKARELLKRAAWSDGISSSCPLGKDLEDFLGRHQSAPAAKGECKDCLAVQEAEQNPNTQCDSCGWAAAKGGSDE